MPVYPADTAEPQPVAPLDPSEVVDYDIDWTDALQSAETIAASAWSVPDGLLAGDGVTVVTTSAGNVTPPSPSISSGRTIVWLYVDTAEEGAAVTVTNTIRTSGGRVYERSIIITVGSK